jgi:arylsulfatase A-like enzyme
MPAMWSTLLLTGLAALAAPAQTNRPDVLMIVVDDASWEDFALAPTDDIAALAAFGRVYTRCYVSPTCSPSRYQLHFGRYPHHNLIGTALGPDDEGAPTEDSSLPERLGAAGYSTALFGKWHVNGKNLPITRPEAARVHGYQTWRAGSFGNISATGSHFAWKRIDDGLETVESRYSTLAINEALVDWWQGAEGPRFAVCSYLAPHEPFETPPKELVPEAPVAIIDARSRFELALRGVDNAVAILAQSLDLTNTYVFLLPDNGTPIDVWPPSPKSSGYKLTPQEGGVRVPLVVWGPGVVPGIDDGLVQAVDLPATILELTLGESPPADWDAISFAASLAGGSTAREHAFVHRFAPNGAGVGTLTFDDWAVVRKDGWKLVRNGGQEALYDLVLDPWESSPVVDPTIAAALDAVRKSVLGQDWPYPF